MRSFYIIDNYPDYQPWSDEEIKKAFEPKSNIYNWVIFREDISFRNPEDHEKIRLSDNKSYYDYLLSDEFGDIDELKYYIEEYLDEIETEIAESKKN